MEPTNDETLNENPDNAALIKENGVGYVSAKKPWDRLEDEREVAFQRFVVYREGRRNLSELAREWGIKHQTLRGQAFRYRWAQRAAAYDQEVVQRTREEARKQAIIEAETKRVALEEATRDQVMLETTRIALASLKNVASWDDTGLTLKASDELSDDDAAAIQEISYSFDKAGNPIKKVKMHNKLGALDKLGIVHKLWGSQQESASAQTVNNYLILVKAFENPRFVEALMQATEGIDPEEIEIEKGE